MGITDKSITRFIVETIDDIYCVTNYNLEENVMLFEDDGETVRLPLHHVTKVTKEISTREDITAKVKNR